MTLLLAQLMVSLFVRLSRNIHRLTTWTLQGIYLLSTVVQLRTSFPPPPPPSPPTPSSSLTPTLPGGAGSPPATANLFSTIPAFEVFGSLFDWSFLLAAGGTAFGRWSRERVDGVGD
jgi:hypothetical protein